MELENIESLLIQAGFEKYGWIHYHEPPLLAYRYPSNGAYEFEVIINNESKGIEIVNYKKWREGIRHNISECISWSECTIEWINDCLKKFK